MSERPEADRLYRAALMDPANRKTSWLALREEIYAPRRKLAAEVLAEYPNMSASELGRRIGVGRMSAAKYKRRYESGKP